MRRLSHRHPYFGQSSQALTLSGIRSSISLARMGRYGPQALLMITALNVFFWFPSGAPIGWGDAGLVMYGANPGTLLHVAMSPWNGLSQLGVRSAASMTLLPLAAYFDVAHHLGLSAAVAEGLYFFAIQSAGMLAMFAVTKRVGRGKISAYGAAMAALFYNFVPLTFENYWMIGNSSVILIALAPLAILVALRVREHGLIRGCIELIAVEYFCFAAFQDPAYFLPVLVLTAMVALLASDRGSEAIGRNVGRLVTVAVAGVAAAAWYVIPDLFQLNSFFHQAIAEASPATYLAAADQNVSLRALVELRAFRTGSPAFASYWAPAWRLNYGSSLFQLVGLVLFSVILIAFVVAVRRRDWHVAALAVAGVAGLFLCLGGNPPIGALYMWLFKHVPYFTAFRDPTNKWTPWILLPWGLVFGYGVTWLFQLADRRTGPSTCKRATKPVVQAVLGVMLAALVLGYGFPMFSGGPGDPRISSQSFVLKRGIRAPASFAQARGFLQRQPGWFRVLVVPLSLNGYRWFKWPRGYDGPDLSWLQFGVPSLSSPYAPPIWDGGRFLFSLATLSPADVIRVAEGLGCRYVLAEGDAIGTGLSYFSPPRPSAADFVSAAERLGGDVVLKRGPLTLVAMPRKQTASLVSVATVASAHNGRQARLVGPYKYSSVGARAVLSLPSGLDLVTFSEAYDTQWHLSLTPIGHRAGSVTVERHMVMDGYGNAWLVRVAAHDAGERMTAAFTYSGTVLEEIGAVISAITICGLVTLGLVGRLRRHPVRRAGASC